MLNFKTNTEKRQHKAKVQRIKFVSKEILQEQLDTKIISLKGYTILLTSPNPDIFVLLVAQRSASSRQ